MWTHAVASRPRLEPEADEADPGAGQRVAEHRGVVDQRLAGREPRERAGAQLDLAAGLERDRAARRQLPDRGRGLAHRVERRRPGAVVEADGEPLDLDAETPPGAGAVGGRCESALGDEAPGFRRG